MPFQIDKPDDTCKLPEALLQSIASYIDENYTEDFATYGFREKGLRSRQALEDCTCSMALP